MTCGVTADADTGQTGYGGLGGLSKFKRKGDAGGNASLGGGFLRMLLKVGRGGTSHSLLVENSDPQSIQCYPRKETHLPKKASEWEASLSREQLC